MFCTRCGNQVEGKPYRCPRCGGVLPRSPEQDSQSQTQTVMVVQGSAPTHLCAAILTTIFCCLPFGIVAIIYSIITDGHNAAGDIAAAKRSSAIAKAWCTVALVVGLITILWCIFTNLGYILTLL